MKTDCILLYYVHVIGRTLRLFPRALVYIQTLHNSHPLGGRMCKYDTTLVNQLCYTAMVKGLSICN